MEFSTPVVVDTDVVSFLFKDHSLAPAYKPFSPADHWQFR